MAKLKSMKFHHRAENGEFAIFESDASVDSEGIFSLTVPEWIVPTASSLAKKPEYAQIKFTKPRTNWRVSGRVLRDCEGFINASLRDFMVCEVNESLVISYFTDIKVSYMRAPDGSIYPSGVFKAACYGNGGQHCGSLNGTYQGKTFSVGIAAAVLKKTEYVRASGVKTKYEFASLSMHSEPDTYGGRLNAFNGLLLRELEKGKMIPYTEEAAKFFYEAMLSLCKLADRMESFFGDDERVMLAIQNQTSLLGGPSE